MNPCINCPLDAQGCHESGFANAKCAAWSAWKTSLLIFKAECRLKSGSAYRINPFPESTPPEGIRARRKETKEVRQVPKFQIANSQSGEPDGEPFEAESLEEAQRIVLEWNGITIKEVKKE